VVTVIAYRHVALSMGPVVESLGYVFIAVLSYFFLREKLSRRKILGYVLIVAGVCLTAF
jgi:drug/metabolite transporter (DMT)-like permease